MIDSQIFIGSHHKCGTVWIEQIFKLFTDSLKVEYAHTDGSSSENAKVLFSSHSHFPSSLSEDYVGVHIIRDPRDVCVSGAAYHITDHAIENESWLRDFSIDGIPYFEFVRSLDFRDRLIAESEHITSKTIDEILLTTKNANFLTIKYEDLISEFTLVDTCREISRHLQLESYEELSLIGAVMSTHRYFGDAHQREHFTSDGKPAGWKNISPKITALLNSLLGDSAGALGYI